jgi:hypothetical protein
MGQANPVAVLPSQLYHRVHLEERTRVDQQGNGGADGIISKKVSFFCKLLYFVCLQYLMSKTMIELKACTSKKKLCVGRSNFCKK